MVVYFRPWKKNNNMDTELSECPPGDVLYDPTAELPSCDDDIRKDQFILPPVGGFVEVRSINLF